MSNHIYGTRWEVIEPLGEGGQGQVFKVKDKVNDNKVYVLKRLKNINRVERFKSEIEAIEKLHHPNIVNLVDYDIESAKPYLVAEYCSGGELTYDYVSKLSTIERLTLFSEICKAVGYAHENGIIHRDIKPANILLKEDKITPVIADFGICFDTDEGLERLTETVEQVGARFYMAPELRDGRAEDSKITAKSDVYSLGKILYWLFRGRVMDRENFEDREWELRNSKDFDHSLNFVYDVLKKTIILNSDRGYYSDGNDRIADANELAKEIDRIIYILNSGGRYLDIDIPQRCIFCAIGQYKLFAVPTNYNTGTLTDLSGNFPEYPNRIGYTNSNSFCYVCENCGNIQFFNISKVKTWRLKEKLKLR